MHINIISIILITVFGLWTDSLLANYFENQSIELYLSIFLFVTILSTITRFGLNENLSFSVMRKEKVSIDIFSVTIILVLIAIASSILYLKFSILIMLLGMTWIVSLNIIQVVQDYFKTIPSYFYANVGTLALRSTLLIIILCLIQIEVKNTEILLAIQCALYLLISCVLFFKLYTNIKVSLFKFVPASYVIIRHNSYYGINNIFTNLQAQIVLLLILIIRPPDFIEITFAAKFMALGGIINMFLEKSFLGAYKKLGKTVVNYFILGIIIYYFIIFLFVLGNENLIFTTLYGEYAPGVQKYVEILLLYSATISFTMLFNYSLNLSVGITKVFESNALNLLVLVIGFISLNDPSFMNVMFLLILVRMFLLIYFAFLHYRGSL